MMHKAWSRIEEVPYCFFLRSYVKLQSHTALKIVDFDPNWPFPDCISSSNYTNPGYGLSLVDTLWNAGSYRQPLEQEGNPMT